MRVRRFSRREAKRDTLNTTKGEQSSKTRDEINSVANYKFIKQMKTYVKLNFSSVIWE